jgi:hypothetical protein
MDRFKINSKSDNGTFFVTESYKKLYNTLKSFKTTRGRIVHVIGAPGTGKSTNIYAAINELGLDVYDVGLNIKDANLSSNQIFDQVFIEMKQFLNAESKGEVYKNLSKYDALLFADKFHDAHLIDSETVGFSLWTKKKGLSSFKFYLLCINEYLQNRKEYSRINILLQTAWRVKIRGKKYDLFSDFGMLSGLFVYLMERFFEVVEIKYSNQETIEIVQKHVNADEKTIAYLMDKYGNKPRIICYELENGQ